MIIGQEKIIINSGDINNHITTYKTNVMIFGTTV